MIAATPYTESGEIDFTGEDYSLWRFRFAGGTWREDSGHVEYDPGVPLCKSIFASNTTTIRSWKNFKRWPENICPRCGAAMPDKSTRAISRAADCEICAACGTSEALIAYAAKTNITLVDDWLLLKCGGEIGNN